MNRTTATHEAGHAVGRLLNAGLMGYDPMQAVEVITMGGEIVRGLDGSAMRSQGQTMGPAMSAPLEQLVKEYATSKGLSSFKLEIIRVVGSQEDIRISSLSRMSICVMAAAAESKQQRIGDPTLVFRSPACSGDRSDFMQSCVHMGLGDDEASSAEKAFISHAKALMALPEVWAAVNAIAFALVKSKEDMSGAEVHRLAWPHLQGLDIDPLPQGWRQ